jgi:hypothetical protein
MSFGAGGGDTVDFETAHGRDFPGVRQFNLFLENRVGSLMDVVRRLEASNNQVVAFSVEASVDYAIIRLVPTNPERARETLQFANIPFLENDLLAVQLPEGEQPLVRVCKALLGAEINIHYAYTLMLSAHPAVAFHVDNHELGVAILQKAGFHVLSEGDLEH